MSKQGAEHRNIINEGTNERIGKKLTASQWNGRTFEHLDSARCIAIERKNKRITKYELMKHQQTSWSEKRSFDQQALVYLVIWW